jgi:hypothetical protein
LTILEKKNKQEVMSQKKKGKTLQRLLCLMVFTFAPGEGTMV